ncbi:response regulator [Paenibacillus sp. GD4]|uniref:response regulator transcription factor n=1 Tax=Paenibacillus sp. GD4 TaxID=3068890 RepID=UPI002796DFF8|nr:response regulator [Paenibacillus sp. GD4]MDQ1914651.1 response regulator [Paenibacillus sp. GD4]
MWKALLVEDEPFVRRTIIQLLDWEAMGYEIVGEADDGETALEQIEAHRPDLVITDIMMPNMDGLELLRRAKSSGFEGAFVMLTCMNEFEYARQALEYGANGYLLKLSMSPDSLKQVLDKVKAELVRKELEKSRLDYHKGYEEAWSAYAAGVPEIAEQRGARPWVNSRLPYVGIGAILHGSQAKDIPSFIQSWFGSAADSNAVIHSFTSHGVTSIFCWSTSLRNLTERGAAGFAVFTGPVPVDRFPAVWYDILQQLTPFWYGEKDLPRTRHQNKENPAGGLSWKKEKELYRLVEESKADAALTLLNDAFALMEQEQTDWLTVKETAARIERWLNQQLPEALEARHYKAIDTASHHELLALMTEKVNRVIERQIQSSGVTTDHPEVNAAIAYIHRNYGQQITLKTLAKQINIDEKYLSGLFVKKTGEPLIQYLQRVRVEKAKRLLMETDLTVQEIGEQVGFVNANYFFKIFKRWSEVTPNDFRRLGARGTKE